MWPHQCWVEGKHHLPQPAGNTSPNAGLDTISFLCCKDTLLAPVHPGVLHVPTSFFTKLLSSWVATSWCLGLFFPRCRTLHISLLNFMKFLSAHFSSLSRSLWMAAQLCGVLVTCPSFVSSANLVRLHSVPSSRSLMKVLNRTGPSIYSWGPLLVTGLQLDFVPLITTLWAWPFSQFSIHVSVCMISICQQLIYEDLTGHSVSGLPEVKTDPMHCSHLVCRASYFIVEVYQVGQAWLPCWESMLTSWSQLLVLHMPGKGLWA